MSQATRSASAGIQHILDGHDSANKIEGCAGNHVAVVGLTNRARAARARSLG